MSAEPREVGLVYASYSNENVEAVLTVVRLMQRELDPLRIRVWMDKTDIRLGEDWYERMKAARSRARVWLIFMGAVNEGRYFGEESRIAQTRANLAVIPVLLPEAPGWEQIPKFLSARHGVRLRLIEDIEAVRSVARDLQSINTLPLPADQAAATPPVVPVQLPPTIAALFEPKGLAPLLARMALSYPDIIPCLEQPDAAKVMSTLAAAKVDDLERLVGFERSLKQSHKDFEPDALWLAWIQSFHGKGLEQVAEAIKTLPVRSPDTPVSA